MANLKPKYTRKDTGKQATHVRTEYSLTVHDIAWIVTYELQNGTFYLDEEKLDSTPLEVEYHHGYSTRSEVVEQDLPTTKKQVRTMVERHLHQNGKHLIQCGISDGISVDQKDRILDVFCDLFPEWNPLRDA